MPHPASRFRTPLIVPVARPTRLSNPVNEYSEDELRTILAKSDGDLSWSDFRCVLGQFFAAGTYEESLYFLPFAFEHILSHDDDALDLISAIVWFVSMHTERLEADHLLTAALARLTECFEHWSRQFAVTHFDRRACAAKGWRLDYFDYVEPSEVICEGTCDLERFGRHADIGDNFFRSLADHGADAVKAAWFLELARSQRDVYRPPDRPVVRELLSDIKRLRTAASVVSVTLVRTECSPTYWRDTLAALGITV